MSSESDLKDALDVDPQLSDEEIEEMFSSSVKKSKSKIRRGTIGRVVVVTALVVMSSAVLGTVLNKRTEISPAKKTPVTGLNTGAPSTIYAVRFREGRSELDQLSSTGEFQKTLYRLSTSGAIARLISDSARHKLYMVLYFSGQTPAHVLYVFDTQTQDFSFVANNVDNVMISPDGSKAIMEYESPSKQTVRDLDTGKETGLTNGDPGYAALGWNKEGQPMLSFIHTAVTNSNPPHTPDVSYTDVIRYITAPEFHAYEVFMNNDYYENVYFQMANGNYLTNISPIAKKGQAQSKIQSSMVSVDGSGAVVRTIIKGESSIVSCNATSQWCVAKKIGDGTGNGGVPHLLVGHADGNYTQIPDGYETATL